MINPGEHRVKADDNFLIKSKILESLTSQVFVFWGLGPSFLCFRVLESAIFVTTGSTPPPSSLPS